MRNSWPTSTSTCSIGVPDRRSWQYSFMNSAESSEPASICMACESLEGAVTFSEEWVVGLYQYICVLLSKGRSLRCTRCYERQNVSRGSEDPLSAPIHPSARKGHTTNFACKTESSKGCYIVFASWRVPSVIRGCGCSPWSPARGPRLSKPTV